MNDIDLDRMFKAKDWSAVDVAAKAGPSIVPAIEHYLKSPDELIRLLAVDCIAAAGGPRVPELLIGALADPNEQVRINAINGLHENLPMGHEAALLFAWDSNHTRDGFVRQQIPMIFGQMQARQQIGPLRVRIAADKRQEVRDGMVAGLCKLGDGQGRTALAKMLNDARGKRTAELMEFVKYIDEPWVVPLLVPVLERRDVAEVVDSHIRSVTRRECDLAVDEILRLSKAKFSFPINEIGQYTDAQIEEVRRSAQSEPGP